MNLKPFFLISALLLLFSCHEDKKEPKPDTPNNRTVIVYMSGENNLYINVAEDLEEMTTGSLSLSKGNRLVAFVDDTSSFGPYIVELKGGRRDTIRTFSEDFYASDPARFREVIEWIEAQYPTLDNDYALVLWGHATGWLINTDTIASAQARLRHAYGQDNGRNTSYTLGARWMNITQMAKALEGLPPFTYILADCCCMATAEVTYELRHCANYLIGSPAEIPGWGAPYHILIPHLFSRSATFYQDIVDSYFDYYTNYFNTSYTTHTLGGRGNVIEYSLRGYSVPLSVVKLSEMEALAEATSRVLQAPASYDLAQVPFYFGYDMPVMYDLSAALALHLPATDYQQWSASFRRAVPYLRYSKQWMTDYTVVQQDFEHFIEDVSTVGAMSMHFPQARYNFNGAYSNYNAGLRTLGWYSAVGWSRYE